jgi:hypothetical protein
VDPNRFPTTVWFEFGATPSYGIKTSDQAISGNGFRPVGASVVGLDPGRLYHFRAVATNQIGQTVGEDRTFAIPDAVQPSVGLSPVDTDLDAVEKARVLRVLVSSEEAVELSLTATMRKSGGDGSGKRAPKRIVVARGNLTMEREGDGVAQLALTRAGRRALKGVERAKLSLQVTATDLAGNSAVSGRRLALSR